jgi:hypothetical protein
MRTKTLLLSAAALLAAGFVSSQAQPVYSQNIVGYASLATPSSGVNYLITVPFQVGVSNGANEIFGNSLPAYSSLLVWNNTHSGYIQYYSDASSASGWDDVNFAPTPAPTLPVGQGFFLNPSAPNVTNTFAGTVAVYVGASNQMVFNASGVNYLVASVVPYAGYITNGNSSTGGPNLNGLPAYSSILLWNGHGYTLYYSDPSSASGWDDSNFAPLATPPSITVGQAFFLNISSAPYTWTTGL